MQKRKGFTLVELVIVIAVIAILAGVLIGTFASVINRANESAKLQEMKAAEIEKKSTDILNKLDNAQWFGWEDLEAKIGSAVQSAIANLPTSSTSSITSADLETTKIAIINAVDQSIAKYAASAGQGNTSLTAEEVQYIVEQAVAKSGAVTEAQVKGIVDTAVAKITNGLSQEQIQTIVDAAVAKVQSSQLTAADLADKLKAVASATTLQQVLELVESATKTQSTLTAEEVADIVSRYVNANGTVKGDYTWYKPQEENLSIKGEKAEEQLVALSTLAASGETFKGQTITIEKLLETIAGVSGSANSAPTITLTEKWIPIKVFEGTLDGNGATIRGIDVEVVYWASENAGSTGVTYNIGGGSAEPGWYGERKAFGFIGLLGGTVKNLTLEYDTNFEDPKATYTVFGGVAGSVLPDSTVEISHVTVGGKIEGYQCIGGLLGTIFTEGPTKLAQTLEDETKLTTNVTLHDNTIDAEIITHVTSVAGNKDPYGHVVGSYVIGELNMYANFTRLVVSNNTTGSDASIEANGGHNGIACYVNNSARSSNWYADDAEAMGIPTTGTDSLTMEEFNGTLRLLRK